MRRRRAVLVLAAALAAAAAAPAAAAAQDHGHPQIRVPGSLRVEHEEIHHRLHAAMEAPGPVGAAARDLAAVLAPHFQREEQIALPPLGLLEPLARGEYDPGMRAVLPMTDSLRAELPRMLEEHERIGAAARRLEAVAREAGDAEAAELARELQGHAQAEKEIHYPAALLVGEVVRARGGR